MLRQRQDSGFTLLEIMVVILIIGLSTAVVSIVVSRGGPEQELRQIAERFAQLGEFASERAVLSGRPMGLLLEPPAWSEELNEDLEASWRYRWQRLGRGGWEDEPGIEAVELPADVQLDVTIQGQLWEWDEAPEVRLPVAVFYPSGEVTPFVVEFRDEDIPDQPQHVEVDVWGEVTWRERPRPPEDADDAF